MIVCKVKQTFYLGSFCYQSGTNGSFTDEQTSRLSDYIEPVKIVNQEEIQENIQTENTGISEPVKDKMIKTKKTYKKGARK